MHAHAVLPADVTLQCLSRDERDVHWEGCVSGQPVRVVVAGGVAAGAVSVAEHEGHGGEQRETAAKCT